MSEVAQQKRRFWIAAGIAVVIAYLFISNNGTDTNSPESTGMTPAEVMMMTDTTISGNLFDDYVDLTDCKARWGEDDSTILEPLGCSTIRFKCSRFKDLGLNILNLQKDVADGLAVPQDLAEPIQSFVDETKIWIDVPESDSVRVSFAEMTTVLRRLRVAVISGDGATAAQLTSTLAPLMTKAESLCSDVPE
jgi:hypothetical protein